MSRLSVYWPDECDAITTAVLDEPHVLQFPRSGKGRFAESRSVSNRTLCEVATRLDVIARAKLLFSNRQCCRCRSHAVELQQLDDAQVNRQGLEIPGTATITGFRCHSCNAEWNS